jgi:hypothetical protein
MIMDVGNAGAGEMASPGRRPGLLDRRSFLVGSAAGVGALGLAGCGTTDSLSLAEASKIYGPVPEEKFPIPAADISKVDPKYFRPDGRYDTRRSPARSSSIPAITTSTASRTTDPPRATAPMSAATGSGGAVTPMSGANPNGRPGPRPGR